MFILLKSKNVIRQSTRGRRGRVRTERGQIGRCEHGEAITAAASVWDSLSCMHIKVGALRFTGAQQQTCTSYFNLAPGLLTCFRPARTAERTNRQMMLKLIWTGPRYHCRCFSFNHQWIHLFSCVSNLKKFQAPEEKPADTSCRVRVAQCSGGRQ